MSRICVAAALGLALLPSAARAAAAYHFQDHGASASFVGADATGCIYTVTNVTLFQNRYQAPPEPPQNSAWLHVYVYRYDSCQQVWLLDGGGSAEVGPSAYEFGGGLRSASVKAVITLHDYVSNSPVQVALDLAWTGDGDIFRGALHSHFRYPQYSMLSRSVGSSREAQATGTILVGSTNVVTGSSGFADLTWNQYGTVTQAR